MSIIKTIKEVTFFSSLNNEQLDILASISIIDYYESDYVLCYEKTKSNKLLFLVEGLAKAYKIDKRENEIILYYIDKNTLLSEITTPFENDLLNINSNISFLKNSTILSIDYKLFKENFLNKHILINEFINAIITRNQKLEFLINREFIFDAVTKVVIMLISDLDRFNQLKRHEISLMLHIQPSTLSRVLNKLKRNKVISIHRGYVEVLNMESLELLSREY